MSLSGGIRKQLGPARKRLKDRLTEASALIGVDDVAQLKVVRGKLVANLEYHEKLTAALVKLIDDVTDAAEQEIIEKEVEACTELEIDARETLSDLMEVVSDARGEKVEFMIKMKESERLDREIEKLKLETECKRVQLDNMKDDTGDKKQYSKHVKLPQLTLPTFNGKITEWPSFWDSFNSTINSNRDISSVDKFKYLISCLQGDAKETLNGFNLTDAQYVEAVKHLKSRYDDRGYIIQTYYTSLSNLTKSSNATCELRKNFNFIETQLRSLECMGEQIENNYIISIIKSKLPNTFNLKLEESRNGEWTVDYLRKSIDKLIIARERSEECQEDFPTYEYSGESLLSRDVKIKCVYCEYSHWSDECQKYKTLVDRKGRLKGRCFICLSDKHQYRECRSIKACFYCRRKGNHHQSLCPEKFSENSFNEVANAELSGIDEEISLKVNDEVLMKSAQVSLRNQADGKECQANILLDTGAKRTYITMEKARLLGLELGPPKVVKLNTFGAMSPNNMYINETKLSIKQKDGTYKIIRAKICKNITGPMKRQNLDVQKYEGIWKDLEMANGIISNNERYNIDVLIGSDYYEDIVKAEKIQIDKGLYLVNSTIGWMFSGRILEEQEEEVELSMLIEENVDVNQFWNLETIGLDDTTKEKEEEQLLDAVNNKLLKNGNRYQVGWPWKISKYELPSNYELCESRLKSLIDQLKRNEKLLCKYDEIIKKQLKDGIIEEADCSEDYLSKECLVTHYLPHHLVKNDSSSSSKVRIVYEGCAKKHPKQKSLNECLHRGKNMVANLCGVLIRFRINRIGVVADIKKAYLQLELTPPDRDVTRFLWIKDITLPYSKENIQAFRFCRVIWGIVCSAFLLASVIMRHLMNYQNETSEDISRNIYVDNLISGVPTVAKGITYYKETKRIFDEISMNMCQWATNDPTLMSKIKPEDRRTDEVISVLGLTWKLNVDKLYICEKKNKEVADGISKRKMLQFLAGMYDPLGLLCPIMVQPKLLIQELWKKDIGWDGNVPDEIVLKWKRWIKDVDLVGKIGLDRCINLIGDESKNIYELITFTDSSKRAYAGAVYLKISNGSFSVANLVFAKNRLAPIKEISIPRLELLGVLVGCRISKFIADQLGTPDMKQTILTDSKCVLEWYKSNKELKRFISDKIKEIRSYNVKIGYVKSKENPADIASRGIPAKKLLDCQMWWKGPDWLLNDVTVNTEIYELNEETKNDILNEEKRPKILHEVSMLSDTGDELNPFNINEERFSSYSRLIRVTAWCFRFLSNLKRRVLIKGHLSDDEISKSNRMWIEAVQKQNFSELMQSIEKGKRHSLNNLGVYRDSDGLLKCKGRFQSMKRKNPILLPKSTHFSNLVIVSSHRKLIHGGVSQTLAETRKDYWIIQGRSAVRNVIRRCLICIYWEGGPFKNPPFAPLPEYAVSNSNRVPFMIVGLDYLGPLIVKEDGELYKNWICLFTCLNVRAVHLELVETMSADGFLMCFRRFIARRGKPKLVISDNASQIKLGNYVIDKIWRGVVSNSDVQSYIANEGVKWKYTVEYAPWQGGFYERLVGLTKRSLRKALGKVKVTREQLLTLIFEIEAVINSRPLVYLDDDINSLETLTPAHFISINTKTGVPDVEVNYSPSERSAKALIEMWKKGQIHLDKFWTIWNNEYLQSLREKHTENMKPIKGEVTRAPKVGEVVIIKEEGLPRGSWKLARIEKLIESDIDGIQRAASLVTANGKCIKRPMRLIYPLEGNIIKIEADDTDKNNDITDTNNTDKKLIDSRPSRIAGKLAADKIRGMLTNQCQIGVS